MRGQRREHGQGNQCTLHGGGLLAPVWPLAADSALGYFRTCAME
jgi:hypothetical protein